MMLQCNVNQINKVGAAKPYTNLYRILQIIFQRLQIMSAIKYDVHCGYIVIYIRNKCIDFRSLVG